MGPDVALSPKTWEHDSAPRVSYRTFLPEQWSRGIAEVAEVQGTNDFAPMLLVSARPGQSHALLIAARSV